MEQLGFDVLHAYGTTESYGPSMYCAFPATWAEEDEETRFQLMARQGVPMVLIEDLFVGDPNTMMPVAKDGETIGEIMLRGNTLMQGYLKNEAATREAFATDIIVRATSLCGTVMGMWRSKTGPKILSSLGVKTFLPWR